MHAAFVAGAHHSKNGKDDKTKDLIFIKTIFKDEEYLDTIALYK